MTDEHDGTERAYAGALPDGSTGAGRDPGRARRAYGTPELVEYGTVAKLTQTGGGSVFDFGGMMRMMVCL